MARYRIQIGVNQWWGAAHGRRWGTFEAQGDEEAWVEAGRLLALAWGPPRHDHPLICLQREEVFPQTRLLTGDTLAFEDRMERQPVWVRVAVGYSNTPWAKNPEEAKGSSPKAAALAG